MRLCAYFYPGQGLGGWLVRHWTRSRFGHCAIGIDTVVYEATASGVSKRLVNHFEATAVRIDVPSVDAASMRSFCEAQIGKRYDWPALWLTGLTKWYKGGFRLEDNRRGAWDCSRFVVSALGLDANRLSGPPSPQDVYNLLEGDYGL